MRSNAAARSASSAHTRRSRPAPLADLTKLAYAAGQLVAGSAVSACRIARTPHAHSFGEVLFTPVDGELSHDERDRLYAHLAGCPECRAEAAALRVLKRRLEALGDAW